MARAEAIAAREANLGAMLAMEERRVAEALDAAADARRAAADAQEEARAAASHAEAMKAKTNQRDVQSTAQVQAMHARLERVLTPAQVSEIREVANDDPEEAMALALAMQEELIHDTSSQLAETEAQLSVASADQAGKRAALKHSRAEAAKLEAKLAASEQRTRAADSKAHQLAAELQQLQAQTDAQGAELAAAQDSEAGLRQRVGELEETLDQVVREKDAADAIILAAARARAASLKASEAEAKAEATTQQKRADDLERRVVELQAALDAATHGRTLADAHAQTDPAEESSALREARHRAAEAEAAVEAAERKARDAEAAVAEKSTALDGVTRERDAAVAKLAAARRDHERKLVTQASELQKELAAAKDAQAAKEEKIGRLLTELRGARSQRDAGALGVVLVFIRVLAWLHPAVSRAVFLSPSASFFWGAATRSELELRRALAAAAEDRAAALAKAAKSKKKAADAKREVTQLKAALAAAHAGVPQPLRFMSVPGRALRLVLVGRSGSGACATGWLLVCCAVRRSFARCVSAGFREITHMLVSASRAEALRYPSRATAVRSWRVPGGSAGADGFIVQPPAVPDSVFLAAGRTITLGVEALRKPMGLSTLDWTTGASSGTITRSVPSVASQTVVLLVGSAAPAGDAALTSEMLDDMIVRLLSVSGRLPVPAAVAITGMTAELVEGTGQTLDGLQASVRARFSVPVVFVDTSDEGSAERQLAVCKQLQTLW